MTSLAFAAPTLPPPALLRARRVATSRAPHRSPLRRARVTLALLAPGGRRPSAPDAAPHVELPAGFETTMRDFCAALGGVYVALSGAGPAAAVPEALVEAFKSTPASLAHPTLMWTLLGTSLYTFYLGYQASRVRKVDDRDERKRLAQGRFGDRHFRTSSALFATMTVATFSGMANTYARTGKLFPGPHLYAGLSLVATMAVMSAFVPYMLKGKNWARNSHFTIAFAAVALFGWQAKSGMAIVSKLLGWE